MPVVDQKKPTPLSPFQKYCCGFSQLSKMKCHLRGYTIASIVVSMGGVLNGFDTGTIGAVTIMPSFLKVSGPLSGILQGFTVSLILLTGGVTCMLSGWLADRFGRLSMIGIGAAVFTAGALLQGTAFSIAPFLVGRALAGFGQGLWISTMYVYITEIAPSSCRGKLASFPQLGCCLGIALGYFTCFGTARLHSPWSWRTVYVIQMAFAVLLTISCIWLLPSSPRWLMDQGRSEDATLVVQKLGISKEEATRDILCPTDAAMAKVPTRQAFFQMFQAPYRSRTLLAIFILTMTQFTGIDGVLYVSKPSHPPGSH